MHNFLFLDDNKLNFIEEPFIRDFVSSYWNKIALVIPVTTSEHFQSESYFDVINTGHTVDWLFAIVPNSQHPLDVDWLLLRPRQAHPWWYGNHPATSNINGGGSTVCFEEMLTLIETLSKDDRVQKECCFFPELYSDNPPKTFESLYSYDLFRGAQHLAVSLESSFDDLYKKRSFSDAICLGLYGCNDATLNMLWKVEPMLNIGSRTYTTVELADKVTLAMRLSGESDHYLKTAPSRAFEQWMGRHKDNDNKRESLIIKTKDDIWFCQPQVSDRYRIDAYFLDCEQQTIKRLGGNGDDPTPTLESWGIDPEVYKEWLKQP